MKKRNLYIFIISIVLTVLFVLCLSGCLNDLKFESDSHGEDIALVEDDFSITASLDSDVICESFGAETYETIYDLKEEFPVRFYKKLGSCNCGKADGTCYFKQKWCYYTILTSDFYEDLPFNYQIVFFDSDFNIKDVLQLENKSERTKEELERFEVGKATMQELYEFDPDSPFQEWGEYSISLHYLYGDYGCIATDLPTDSDYNSFIQHILFFTM